ncbi:Centromere protein H [Acipenser ruthenus]|uniref:Centromere protein H n=1 Tax=Acipenser ruthenus TaxID=7906 RepID=A0A444URS1_ACIRT|nr:Centromere protein H [Acipenser ruthenus]
MDAFQNLHEACSKLGHLALNSCQSPVPANTDNEESLARILRLREQVADQCLEMKIRIKSALKKEALGKLMEIRAAKKRKEEKMQALQSEMLKKGQGSMEKHLKMVTLVQNVLQGIIIGSRVNWAADPKLKEIALGLEKNPAFD